MKELRAIWAEDQYQLLDKAESESTYYFARQKNESVQVFLRSANSRKRKLLQNVSSEHDLYWCTFRKALVREEPESASVPSKSECIISGYRYGHCVNTAFTDFTNLVDITETTLTTGAVVIWLMPKNAKGWMVSLHGGPDSAEGLEIRYGGLYRDLFREGIGVAIVNYRGSSNLSKDVNDTLQEGRKAGIIEDFQALLNSASALSLSRRPFAIFGVSFGGALALIVQQHFAIPSAVLSSPLLDLDHQRRRGGAEFAEWFQENFHALDWVDLSLERLTAHSGVVEIFYSPADEVLGGELFAQLRQRKTAESAWSFYPQAGGHSPVTYKEYRQRFGGVLRALLTAASAAIW